MFAVRHSLLATGLLASTEHFLESSLDECSRELFDKMDKSSEKVKDIALEACRSHKKLFNEIQERSSKALGFAKMLQKDLGIAAEFKVEVSSQKILELLKNTKHVKVCILITVLFFLAEVLHNCLSWFSSLGLCSLLASRKFSF